MKKSSIERRRNNRRAARFNKWLGQNVELDRGDAKKFEFEMDGEKYLTLACAVACAPLDSDCVIEMVLKDDE